MPASKELKSPIENQLLAALPAAEYKRVLPHLEHVSFSLGESVYESGTKLKNIYFPTTCIVSLLYTMENGTSAEIGVVGNEGVLGIALFMGGDTTPNRAIAQSAGDAFMMKAQALRNEFILAGKFQHSLLRYTQALITQISQTAVCNRLHPIEQQLCRWLLLSHDRLQADELNMTQELIANMLGVRRKALLTLPVAFNLPDLLNTLVAASRSSTARASKQLCASVIRLSKTNMIACSAR